MDFSTDRSASTQINKTGRRASIGVGASVEIRVSISLTRQARRYSYSGVAHDISEGGLRLFSTGDLFEGETISIHFALPYGRRVLLQGLVRSRDRHEYGVEYLDPSPADREEIIRNCRAQALLK